MAETEQDKPTGTKTVEVEVESTVNDPGEQREDDVARQRSTSPVPRVGDTWEDMTDHGTSGPQRRIGVLEVDMEAGQVHVENKETRRKSHVSIDRFEPSHWRFIG